MNAGKVIMMMFVSVLVVQTDRSQGQFPSASAGPKG